MERRLKRPRDPISRAKLISDIATGQVKDEESDNRNAAAVELGKRGGKARTEKVPAKRRLEIAKKAAKRRWAKKTEQVS